MQKKFHHRYFDCVFNIPLHLLSRFDKNNILRTGVIFFWKSSHLSSIQYGGIETFCPLGYSNIFGLGVLADFGPKISTKKNWQNSQRFWTMSKSSCIIFYAKFFWYSQYPYHSKKNRHVLAQKIRQKNDKIHKDFWTITSLRVPKCPNTPILYTTDMY